MILYSSASLSSTAASHQHHYRQHQHHRYHHQASSAHHHHKHNHHHFIGSDNGDAPVSLPHPNPRRSDDNNSDGLRDIEGSMWEPLPFRFQKSSPSMFAEMNQQLQESFDFDDIFHSCSRISCEGDGRSTKRQRPS